MKAQISIEYLFPIILMLLVVMLLTGSLYKSQESTQPSLTQTALVESCFKLKNEYRNCEDFGIHWDEDFTKIKFSGKEYTLKGICELNFGKDSLEKCKKACQCPGVKK